MPYHSGRKRTQFHRWKIDIFVGGGWRVTRYKRGEGMDITTIKVRGDSRAFWEVTSSEWSEKKKQW